MEPTVANPQVHIADYWRPGLPLLRQNATTDLRMNSLSVANVTLLDYKDFMTSFITTLHEARHGEDSHRPILKSE